MYNHASKFIFLIFSLIIIFYGCGSDSNYSLQISGQITGQSSSANSRDINSSDFPALPNHTVCCFGSCGISDNNGMFSFNANANSFTGGEVLCTLADPLGVEQQFILSEILNDPSLIEFQVVLVDGQIVSTVLNQNSNSTGSPMATPTTQDVTPTPEPSNDQLKNGCKSLVGSYTGNGGCGIGSTVMVNQVANISGLEVTRFGDNGTTLFYYGFGNSALSLSNDLDLFGKGGHSCSLTCDDPTNTSFSVFCSSSKGACTEIFQ